MTTKDILKANYSETYDNLRKNRVILSTYKYGPARKNFGDKLIEALGCIEKCIAKYKKTGNTEYLVDAGNYCMFEYMYPQHPDAHFKATDSGESAGIVGISINEIMSL